MATIRPLEKGDIPRVSELFLRVSPEARWESPEACGRYVQKLLFENPWRHLDIPSWVAEEGGALSAFYLLVPRSMMFRGERIRVAVGCQISVDPARRRSLLALELAKAALNGSQDLTLADGAHERSRDMWLAIGGCAPLLYNLHWIRPLRPARQLLTSLAERGALPAPLAHAARPFAAAFDGIAGRSRWNRHVRHFHDGNGCVPGKLDSTDIADGIQQLGCAELLPDYNRASLDWLFEEIAAKAAPGTLRGRAVRSRDGRLDGWYLYILNRGGTSEVLQIVARKPGFDPVFRSLLADAWENGAAALRGRGEPGRFEEMSARHCWFRREGQCTLVHTRRDDIHDAISRGDAFLSRLEGEWWLRLVSG